MALFIFLCTRGNLVIAFLWCLEMAYRLAVQCNVIKFMMLLCITIPSYAPSHEKFGVTPSPHSPSSPHTHTHTHTQHNAQEHQSKAGNIHQWICMRGSTHLLLAPNLSGNSPQSFLNHIQTYATTDLFWQPIICSLSFAFSIFHAHFFSITVESLASCEEDIKICGAEPQWWNKWCNAWAGV